MFELFELRFYDGRPVLDRTGKPFQYTTQELARLAAKHISVDRQLRGIRVVPA